MFSVCGLSEPSGLSNKEQGEVLERKGRVSYLRETSRTSLAQHMDNQRKRRLHSQERIETTSLDHRTMRLLFLELMYPTGGCLCQSFAPCQANGPSVASSWAFDVALMHWSRSRLGTETETRS